jgi:hypothetical protein
MAEAVKDPLLWSLVVWAALSVLVWGWRLSWYLCGFRSAFPLDRYTPKIITCLPREAI